MRVITEEMEIRGKEVKTSKQGNEYILVRAEDETGKTTELCDKTMSRLSEYTKGRTCRLIIEVEILKVNGQNKTNLTIVGISD